MCLRRIVQRMFHAVPTYIRMKRQCIPILTHLGYEHCEVNHKSGEYVKGEAYTNGVESFRALLKRGYYGIYHRMSVKHLQKYINEFADRTNIRPMDTIDQISLALKRLAGKRLAYYLDGSKQGLRP